MTANFSRRNFLRQTTRAALATPFISLVGCEDRPARANLTQLVGATMGTTYQVKIPQLPIGVERQVIEHGVVGILDDINQQMSTYRPDSELSQFNLSSADLPLKVSAATLKVVNTALSVSRWSKGAFDPTIGPLVDLWGFGAGSSGQFVPSEKQIRRVLHSVGYRNVQTKPDPGSLHKRRDDLGIDLSGIAKGFGVDTIAEYLESVGIDYYLVEIGGELRGRGYSRYGEEWRVGIEKPGNVYDMVQRVVRLNGKGLATSGDYRNFFKLDGLSYSHILNPRNGQPIRHGLASVTVIANTSMQADALSTALMVLGPEEGLDLAKRKNIAAFFISRYKHRFVEIVSPAFEPYLIA